MGDRSPEFMLDTSIVVPIAIAGAITIAVIFTLICCRRISSLLEFRRTGNRRTSSLDSNNEPVYHNSTVNTGRRATGSSNTAGGAGGVHHQVLPWIMGQGYYQRNGNSSAVGQRQDYLPPTVPHRANYNSTQVDIHYIVSHHSVHTMHIDLANSTIISRILY